MLTTNNSMNSDTVLALKQLEQNVAVSNELIQKSWHSFTLAESKLANYLISLIKPEKDGSEKGSVYFNVNEYLHLATRTPISELGGENVKRVYDSLSQLRIKGISLAYEDEKVRVYKELSFITGFTIVESKENKRYSKIKVDFHPDILEHLLYLKNKFMLHSLKNVMYLESVHGISMYQFFKSILGERGVNGIRYFMSYKDIRFKFLGDEKKYSNSSDLRKYVVDPAYSTINENTDLNIRYEVTKRGRESGLEFIVSKKKSDKIQERDDNIKNVFIESDEK